MSNVIDFLEALGQDASLRHAPRDEVEQALLDAQIDPALRAAILDADQTQLEALLGAATNVCCMVHAPEDDEDDAEDDETEDDEDDDGDEDDEDEPKSALRRVRGAG